MTRQGPSKRFPFVEKKRLRHAAVVCHRNADADAYLSAFALSRLIGKLAPRCRVDVVTPEGMTTLTKKLSENFPHRTVAESSDDYDLYVAVDVGDSELLRDWKEKLSASQAAVKVLVDHHPLRDREFYDHLIVDEKATSAAEVVFELFRELKVSIDRRTAQALLEGILFDSSHLAIAGEKALRAVVQLIERGADLASARRVLRSEPDYGEVVAKLKGAQRLKVYRLGDWVVATTLVGSFQAHVARSLLSLGADLSVAGGVSDDTTRVSLRGSQRFFEKTGLRLGVDVAEYLAAGLGGHGGGHPTAASFECHAGKEEAVNATLGRLAALLGVEAQHVE